MNGDQAVSALYLLLVLVLVGSALMVRRIPIADGFKMFAGWILIFAAFFIIFTFKDEFLVLGDRMMIEVRGGAVEQKAGEGGELRVRQSADGHFWVNAEVNGRSMRFLIDSGATTTSLSRASALRAGVEPSGGFGVMVQTANGMITVDRGRIESFRVGSIERRNLAVHISDAARDDTNVIGMNFLSSLSAWRVEGRILVLRT
ncbi:MAG: TIGR02281 family clan AA aspartic protease [Sphingomonas sp.]|nr:TIGR02281 family clan AA aspartic protease [Sphingomonas sp.]